jgi:hypothetical protein
LRDVLLLTAGGLLLLIYNAVSLYQALAQAAPTIRALWPRVALGGIAVVLLVGILCGRLCARWARRQAQAPWLAVLPWQAAARARAVRVACLAIGGVLMPLPAFCGWGVSHAVAASGQAWAATSLAVCFMLAFVTAALPGAHHASEEEQLAQPDARPLKPALAWRLVAWLDQWAPRWTGLWAQGDSGGKLSVWWFGSLVIAGGSAAALSQSQSWTSPSVISAVIGGNLAYIAGLRGSPLLSPVLRTSPVSFAVVWAAMARGPLALSLLWFGIAALPAFVVSLGAWRPSLGGFGVLLLLNLLYSTAAAITPTSRRQALLMYGFALYAILYQGVHYGVAYGALVGVAELGLVAFLWRRARQRFRVHG